MSRIIYGQFEVDENNVLVKYHEKEVITEVVIPDCVVEIREGAFAWCENLTNITIPENVKKIGARAFAHCENLTSITIPNSVDKIGGFAFAWCKSLTSITIPNSVTIIGIFAFFTCKNLTSITISNSVTYIGDQAFSCCENLTDITIPNSVTEIGKYAFSNCKNLTSIIIPNSVTEIGDGAFDSEYIEEVNISTYDQFFQLNNYLKMISIGSMIKNYSTGKIKYSEKDMLLFKKYIIENKQKLLKSVISNTSLLNYMLNEIGEKFITYEEAQNLLSLETENKAEKNSLLLEYIDKNYREEIEKKRKNILDELSLDDLNENLDKLNGLGEK